MVLMTKNSDSEFLRHQSCPKCGSSDALGVYSDGHGHCFSCQTYFKELDNVEATANVVSYNRPAEMYGATYGYH